MIRATSSLVALVLAAALVSIRAVAQSGATITVTTTADQYDSDPAACGLREALVAANSDAAFGGCSAGSGADTISLPAGIYQLDGVPGPAEDAAAEGDLDVRGVLALNGAGAGLTIIDGSGAADRVLHVLPDAALTASDLTIQGAAVLTATQGAGIFNQGSLTLQNAEVLSNTSTSPGGGIFNAVTATLTLSRVLLSGNSVGSSFGGGLYNQGQATLTDVVIADNQAGGGAGLASFGEADLRAVTLSANSASVVAGGIYNTAVLTLTTTTISANRATGVGAYGGGLFNASTALARLESTTIVSNSSQLGGGIYSLAARGALQLRNTLLASNVPQNCTGSVTSLGFNLDSASSCRLVAERSNSDARPGPLAAHGGFAPSHSLPADSPAVDAGGACPALDQRGSLRPQGAFCDVGAFERLRVNVALLNR